VETYHATLTSCDSYHKLDHWLDSNVKMELLFTVTYVLCDDRYNQALSLSERSFPT